MNCANHAETPATAFCRSCGKPLCEECQKTAMGTVYCEEHVPAPATAPPPPPVNPYTSPYQGSAAPPVSPVVSNISPGLAFLLGLIPGVGAIYNGQYAKGLVHVVVFGLLISVTNSGAGGLEPLFGVMIPAWIMYMAFEAFHTAKRRQLGETVDEFSSLVPVKSQSSGFPVAPVLLIAVGILFLLHNLEIIRLYQLMRYWPVFLIVLGAYMLYVRITDSDAPVVNREATNERQ